MSALDGLILGDAVSLADAVRNGRVTASAVVERMLAEIATRDEELNAFTLVTAERARAEAAAVDARVAAGDDPGPLAGVPYNVKNLFDLEGEVTVAGSLINREDPPRPRDCTVVERLRSAGAVCLGATNMGEYAYDFITANHHYGPTHNPRAHGRSAGGSSGGSAAAVAAGLSHLALGSDTNGSVRVPASFCGIWGLKPTYGRLSRAGSFLFAGSLDTVGVFGRAVADVAAAYDVMAGCDARDPVCSTEPAEPLQPVVERGIEGLRMARLGGYFETAPGPIADVVERVCAQLSVDVMRSLPEPELARAAAYLITAAEGADLHRRRLATRAAEFDPSARDRFMAGALAPAAWILKAQKFRSWWQQQVYAIFEEVDVLIAPATPLRAPPLEQEHFELGGESLLLRPNVGLYTQPITLVGLPVVAAPVQCDDGLPAAVQLIGRPGSESQLIRVARVLEQEGVCAAPVAAGLVQERRAGDLE